MSNRFSKPIESTVKSGTSLIYRLILLDIVLAILCVLGFIGLALWRYK